jgi:hypothetical protein
MFPRFNCIGMHSHHFSLKGNSGQLSKILNVN